jgi:hypothetical protein
MGISTVSSVPALVLMRSIAFVAVVLLLLNAATMSVSQYGIALWRRG